MNKVLFFAHLRDEAGHESVEIEAAGKTVAELKEIISEKYQVQKLDNSMTAINEEFSSNEEVIKDGDTIAFIPPVSGG
ncbi:MAG TPA: molybdopterin converting factor subunit 1 [Bacillus bacterium]|nr:molybdopterin converting factor subunit 1 [Bacillus sp. (in: firmicutes)]